MTYLCVFNTCEADGECELLGTVHEERIILLRYKRWASSYSSAVGPPPASSVEGLRWTRAKWNRSRSRSLLQGKLSKCSSCISCQWAGRASKLADPLIVAHDGNVGSLEICSCASSISVSIERV